MRTSSFSASSRALILLASLLAGVLLALAGVPVTAHATEIANGDLPHVATGVVSVEDAPEVEAREAIVVDEDGNVLYDLNASASMPIASTTKLMTAVIAVESGVPLDTQYVMSKRASEYEEDGSVAGFKEGDVTNLGDMLRAMMVRSAGDAAVGIAELLAGSVEDFATLMNARAAELGMTATVYVSPDGYDDRNQSCPRDLVLLAKHAMTYDVIRSIVGCSSTTILIGDGWVTLPGTNALLGRYPGMLGIKTGFIYVSGNCFVGAATRGGLTMYVCVLGEEDSSRRWEDVWALLDWAYGHYGTIKTKYSAGSGIGSYVEAGWLYGHVLPLGADSPAVLYDSLNEDRLLDVDVLQTDSSAAYIGKNYVIVTYRLDGKIIASRELLAQPFVIREKCYGPFISDLFYELERNG